MQHKSLHVIPLQDSIRKICFYPFRLKCIWLWDYKEARSMWCDTMKTKQPCWMLMKYWALFFWNKAVCQSCSKSSIVQLDSVWASLKAFLELSVSWAHRYWIIITYFLKISSLWWFSLRSIYKNTGFLKKHIEWFLFGTSSSSNT